MGRFLTFIFSIFISCNLFGASSPKSESKESQLSGFLGQLSTEESGILIKAVRDNNEKLFDESTKTEMYNLLINGYKARAEIIERLGSNIWEKLPETKKIDLIKVRINLNDTSQLVEPSHT